MKNTYLLGSLAVVLAACGQPTPENNSQPTDTIPVRVISLGQQAVNGVVQASGQFTTDDEVYLSFKTNGIISQIYVKEGDKIRAGQLLATLDPTEINAQLQRDQLTVEKAQRDYERTLRLYNDSVSTKEQLENSKTALDLAKQQLNATRFNRTHSEIRAPKDGYVLHKLANSGQTITSGTPVLQTNGASNAKWLLRVGLSDKEWALVKNGDSATIEAGNQVLAARVSRKAEGIDPASGTFLTDIQLNNPGVAAIATGMFGKCTIKTSGQAHAAVWRIPYSALLDGDGTTGAVFITNDRKTAQRIPVTIAGMEKDEVLISGGMEKASNLIVSGSAYLKDQSLIRIIP
ncbi:RND family efflux transporter, MFP subunit [Chitinophaga terrae (ex Kim and Jung 2007)]|jgi:RND family efflux transporter MFP subunit|uniref:RND family efflux transporter, MFP subunit n=1 Tax=Chitinophaga terrae (ex Kim and Jung 2007) TaxID=408074 RepID=A0A1H3YX05_9BACT|nr:efflux RND transporter periplasmic adaptor subunit [Chitinophaga terrae (ex Kim and Jung 2007)]GEP88548.1 transporter [Chitinophaga terrae (ex Kim and Jung 2007)]SEA15986.1 RND family efflux transporter, MFP subunit [Chitinophaga terrae (ex Kim and Jung 2007)]